jgi:hypothetical protein
MTRDDKELWEYFASLYRNSNKGIKGRGKDRRIATTASGSRQHHQHHHQGPNAAYSNSTGGYSSGSAAQPMSRAATNGSMQGNISDRSSRSSSYTPVNAMAQDHIQLPLPQPHHHQQHPVRPMDHQASGHHGYHHFEEHQGYGNGMVMDQRRYM